MSLAPKYFGLQLGRYGATDPKHTLELCTLSALNELLTDLDYVCPFSAKLFGTFYGSVVGVIENSYASKLRVIFRPQVQPWHPSSTLTQEAALAVLRLAPEKFWDFSAALFKEQTGYFDENAVNETRNQTYQRLAKLAAGVAGVDESKVYELLKISDKPGPDGSLNSGNAVTDDIKFLTKSNRIIGVHVTPTVFFNGIEERSISSSFTAQQWEEWLKKNIV
ncbi:hypothetical protein LOZ53_002191 [Ophidiomyces ophidiicola]|nr:hypothetical protein LOZ55_003227 [Ophidiomyces ophidiicola]KAI1993282.1 hypothetical protein LOZ53_002191 [Ophidiomyces ophidiicola]